jgi:hypothetical protein
MYSEMQQINAEQDRNMPNADENAHEETKRLKMNQKCQRKEKYCYIVKSQSTLSINFPVHLSPPPLHPPEFPLSEKSRLSPTWLMDHDNWVPPLSFSE